jgi:hypothetical protein
MFFVSAIRTSSRGWPRSSSTHEPSDPPLRMESFRFEFSLIPSAHYIPARTLLVYFLYTFLNFVFNFLGGRSGTTTSTLIDIGNQLDFHTSE